ncbi:phage terminase large subunit family protein [Serratia marcescens]|uniref:phage terminase large subunit family protein n=1 Tax=Serratia marcescens TaxID=615 RepID=UPI000E56892B|nr:phage terminase large subunit family protein [Serratia marcescens]AXX25033.1 terminase [Serratia marcescens]RTF00482.1 terminase [Serratia marcescens]RTF08351.1 terminase [Serratia marcescens]RTF14998.1 terminase [Serratia marcescens]RTF20163.1 phage terminase large subunit family protein [Serratia marcescens]
MQITTEERTNAAAWQNFTGELRQRRSDVRPPEPLSLSEWANKYAVLSKETSAQTGRFRSFAYQDGMMDAITDPAVTQVSVMKSARVGYTKILDHVVGYYLAHDPSPILIVQPRVEDAEDYSKTEIAPMLRDTPVLAEICGDPKAKDSNQTILKKTFANGANLTLVGANSPGGFRRITCRIILFDEVDGYPSGGAGVEGDQIALGIKRSETFWNRKIALGSTPTVKGTSRIEKAYEESDQRRYYVPCPHCGEFQVLEWGGPETPYGIKWDKDENGEGIPESAYYVCRHNGCVIHHNEKSGMVKRGEWRATKPFKGHAGFHIWAGYSLFPNAAWKYLVAEWLRVKNDPLMRQTFINLVLGEPYEDRGEKALSEKRLLERCEVYAAEVPDGVAVLTAGIDTQDGRFEIEVTGWGRNEESWSIAFDVIEGDLETNEPWQRLDAYLKQVWRRADGRGFTIMAACMDSGGHHTQKVYEFAKERLGRRIWAIKGESARGGKRSPVWPTKKPTSKSKASFKPIIIGVNAAKDTIRGRLHIDPPAPGEPAASYMHFPADRDLNYFSQLLAERSVLKVSGGQRYRVWEQLPGRANEALDCRVYSYAALCGLFYLGLKLNLLADNIAINPDRLLPVPQQPEEKQNLRLPGVIIEEPEKPKRKRLSQLLPS